MANPNAHLNSNWKPGESANPGGHPKHTKGYQRPADRIQKWLNEKSVGDIVALRQDQTKFGKLSGIDGIAVTSIAKAFTMDGLPDRKEVFDRAYGQSNAKLAIEHSGEITGGHVDVSISVGWLTEIVGGGQDRTNEILGDARPILSDSVSVEPQGHGEAMAVAPLPGSSSAT